LPTDISSDELLPSFTRRLRISALWSSALVLGWLLFQVATDRCWFYLNGIHYVSTIASGLFAWLLVFFVLTRWRRVILVVLTVIIIGFFPIVDRNTISAAASCAAATLHGTAEKLEEYRTHSPAEAYPSTVAFDVAALTQRYYRFEYVPIHSSNSLTINAFLLKARPFRYDCGPTYSFIVGPNGKISLYSRKSRCN
jgi:Tfp pilus assembly protein PilE